MGRKPWFTARSSPAVSNVNLPNATETVICTLAGVSVDSPDATVLLKGWAIITSGAAATGITLRIRRGTTVAGTLIGSGTTEAIAASISDDFDVQEADSPGEVASQSYVLTGQISGGAAAATAVEGSLQASW